VVVISAGTLQHEQVQKGEQRSLWSGPESWAGLSAAITADPVQVRSLSTHGWNVRAMTYIARKNARIFFTALIFFEGY